MRSLASDSSLTGRVRRRERKTASRATTASTTATAGSRRLASESAEVDSSLFGRTSTTAPIVTEIGPFFSLKGAATAR